MAALSVHCNPSGSVATSRHTCATLLLSPVTHPTYVQKLLGHASVQLTLDRYSPGMPSLGKLTASAMDEALEDRDDTPENEREAT
jgi:integrase